MSEFIVEHDAAAVARKAAELTVECLNQAIEQHGEAIWVVAGGTTPMLAYQILAEEYIGLVDWAKVIVLIGDERCVPSDDPASNWGTISQVLYNLPFADENVIMPPTELKPQEAANLYAEDVSKLDHFDMVWLGMGEDGHTLSLFPGNEDDLSSQEQAVAVLQSPKDPPERISLTLKALEKTKQAIILVTGESKAAALAQAKSGDNTLPIVKAASVIETANGSVSWLADKASEKP